MGEKSAGIFILPSDAREGHLGKSPAGVHSYPSPVKTLAFLWHPGRMNAKRREVDIPNIYTTKAARRNGLTREQWSKNKRYRVQSGIYAKSGYRPSLTEYLMLSAQSMPGAVLAGVSAAHLHGMRLPWAMQEDLHTYIICPANKTGYRRQGVTRLEIPIEPSEVTKHKGVYVTTRQRTFFDLARHLSEEELIAVADGLLVEHPHRFMKPQVKREDLETMLAEKKGRWGVQKCRAALRRAVSGSDSVKETELRLLLEDHGVGGLVCNVPVYNEVGYVVFEPDLSLPALRISIQYDGAHHGDSAQYQRDIDRQHRTEAAGWIEVRIARRDLTESVLHEDRVIPRAAAKVLGAISARKKFSPERG